MRRSKYRQRPAAGTFSLNITSMTDMFTLLLVFLLQTYSTADFRPEMDPDTQLPLSNTMKEPSKAPQVLITKNAVKIDGETIMTLTDGQVAAADRDPSNPQLMKPLFEALKGKLPAEPSVNDSVLLHADASQTMTSLAPYFNTISAAGFAKVKLATVLGR